MNKIKQKFLTYENGILLMMFFTWGFVFMERLSVSFLFPFFAPELKLNNAQLGLIASVLGVTWAISGWIFSSTSDLIGSRKKVLVPITFVFSICSFLSGAAKSFVNMLLVRALMGLSEGPVLPIAQAAVTAESSSRRRGFNIGFVQSAASLIGATLTPLIVTVIAMNYSWRTAFYIVGIPGLVMTFILLKYMREPKVKEPALQGQVHTKASWADYRKVFMHRNVWLCVVISAFFMTWLFVFTTFAPTFFVEADHFSAGEMGLIMSAVGLGNFLWTIIIPTISDKLGRKPTLILFSFVAILSPLLLATVHGSLAVMMLISLVTTVGNGVFPLFMVIIPSESLPLGVAATAISLTQLIGELVGGTIAPTLAGIAADQFGLSAPLYIAAAGALVCALVGFGLKETAPIKQRVTTASTETAIQ
ncbi:MFS transporter [Kyrpidia spormannii]|uniref:MFS transporter n=1 Tax=Kyrpidia spormannii TaxID=2055160 RepID=A0A2K8N5K1_9BACL|nr:MFS transporter [Kyrpidia spormannii]ATY84087.1 MFS transporter [Kyrpidia spormannii]